MTRRAVHVTPEFFVQLDRQLPAERGPRGEPTAAESAASDLLIIVERFATVWDSLSMSIAGRPDYRDLILMTRLVPYVSIRGRLAPDGAVELIDIDIDLRGLDPGPGQDWTRDRSPTEARLFESGSAAAG